MRPGYPNFFLHISSSLFNIKLSTKIQLPRLPRSALKVFVNGLKFYHPKGVRGGGGGRSGNPNSFLHIYSSWVKIRLHTENQLPMLS